MDIVMVKARAPGEHDRTFITRDGATHQVAVHVVHDLPHLVVESLFDIRDGLWGELATGRHHESNRATTARDPKRRKQGRIVSGAASGATTDAWLTDGHRRAKSVVNAVVNRWRDGPDTPEGVRARLRRAADDTTAVTDLLARLDDATIARAIDAVREVNRRWAETPPGEALRLSWPLPESLFGTRAERAATFDAASELYQRARPDYPDELIERVVTTTGLGLGDRVLEIGCATGKATLPFARRGFSMTCVEPGPNLAAAARRNLAPFPHVTIVERRFEDWAIPGGEGFDLVFAANAWHWLDPETKYRRSWEALRRGGHLAFWSAVHVHPVDGDPFFRDIQQVYDEIGEGLPPGARIPRPGELDDQRDEIEATGLFEVVDVSQYDWEVPYDAERYIELLSTFSGHIAMQPWQRDRLYGEIRRRLGDRPDGLVRRHWGSALHVARRKD